MEGTALALAGTRGYRMRPAEVEVAAEVSELLSDEQIVTVELQVGTGEANGTVLEQLPAPLEPVLVDSIEASGGALVVLSEALGLPTEGGASFDEVLPAMVDRGVGAFISIDRKT